MSQAKVPFSRGLGYILVALAKLIYPFNLPIRQIIMIKFILILKKWLMDFKKSLTIKKQCLFNFKI
jgi:hypothetical protein